VALVTGESFDFAVEVTRAGALVGSRPASPAACLEDALFRSVVAGRVPNDGTLPPLALVPEWGEKPPSVMGLTLSLGDARPQWYGRGVFAPQASALLRAAAKAARDEGAARELAWRVVARAAPPRASRFPARATRAPWPLEPARLSALAPGELDVEIDAAVLDRVREEALRAGPVERAWLLLGCVLHDAERGAASVRAERAIGVEPGAAGASRVHFAFGAESWLAARQAVREAGGLVLVGWAHSHPPCDRCPERPDCEAETVFFSADDREVQAAAFASPYMLGLVVGKRRRRPATEPGFRLYAWIRGEVRERGFRAGGRRDRRIEEERWLPTTR
jgi:proteasome lid subunit RPN8/RPN11